VSGRSYLSIGDVLTLLREEFPDVTISKIRFLESQGLVNPERSPSGYRKFFEHDVERLRWVLRQQREHFLPLKVIRDRLADGDLSEGPAETGAGVSSGVVSEAGVAAVPETAGRNGRVPQPAHVGATAGLRAVGVRGAGASAGAGGRTEEQSAKAGDEAMARILADASRRAALIPEETSDRAPLQAVPEPPDIRAVRTPAPAPAAAAPRQRDTSHATNSVHERRGDAPAKEPATARPTPTVPTAGASSDASRQPVAASEGSAGSAPPAAAASSGVAMVTGASLTAEELCAATGLSEVELAGLQGFGLVEPVLSAGIPTFDEDALTVCNLAAEFSRFGIEPRHLRLYRNAVDREMGLIEQVIIPLLRQRNPESRQRAVVAAEELGTLGRTMRATLLRSALRRHVGG
jgi:DNA-binding transcriptional MerR regulator